MLTPVSVFRAAVMKKPRHPFAVCAALGLLLASTPATARESLGMFSGWGAFRDPATPRCYAIAKAEPSTRQRDYEPYASIGTWPKRAIRSQLHIRLSRKLADNARISLRIGGQTFQLAGGGGDAWPQDKRMDAAVNAALRSAQRMTVSSRDEKGRNFSDSYDLAGAPTAMDAATVGCARLARQ